MLNHIVIMGRLTQDPELRRTQSGVAVASYTLAVDRDYQPKDSQQKETDFINCVAWRSTAEFVSKYFSKGRAMVVSGRLQIRKYTDKDGNNRTAAEVVADNVYFGDSKPQGQGNGSYETSQGGYQATSYQSSGYQSSGYQNSGYQNSGYQSQDKSAASGGSFGASDFALLEDDDNTLPF